MPKSKSKSTKKAMASPPPPKRVIPKKAAPKNRKPKPENVSKTMIANGKSKKTGKEYA